MPAAPMAENISPGLIRVMERAKRDQEVSFNSLAHLIDEAALERAYGRLRKDAAVGRDGITVEQYGQRLGEHLQDLHERLRTMRWRHQPILRVHIPKDQGKTRPIGISSTEDKIVQEALREVLEAIYEPIFRDSSYGFRPGQSAHDAIRALDHALYQGEVNWIVEGDIESFFDSMVRKMLMEMLQLRVCDGSLLRLIGKCLHVGVLDGEEYSEPSEGTAQGSVLLPLLGNVYLHYVLDEWFERDVRPRLQGKATLVRYADDFVIGFEKEEDAKRVMAVLAKRFERYGLRLHPDKTRLLPFGRPPRGSSSGKGPATFDFLGFTFYWRRARGGHWIPGLKTRVGRFRRFTRAVADWCRRHRHQPVKEQHAGLTRRINGHFNYYGVNGNGPTLRRVIRKASRAWHKWLNRRSQRSRLNWTRFNDLLRSFPLPTVRIRVQIWAPSP
ncbi:MAG TPA: group II intron reverse transcriptase/maturase [Polyangia bacterium]|jgi:group II intron reverse transcriptase/maturase|nr:group II intron reverse transcriptase/maturase [Polyangia bacterium]